MQSSVKFRYGLLLAACYGISDELHQYFVPGRHCTGSDVLADTVGALLAYGSGLLDYRLVTKIGELPQDFGAGIIAFLESLGDGDYDKGLQKLVDFGTAIGNVFRIKLVRSQ